MGDMNFGRQMNEIAELPSRAYKLYFDRHPAGFCKTEYIDNAIIAI